MGAGTMGLGIVQVCAEHGFATLLYDVDVNQTQRALRLIAENLQLLVTKGRMTPEKRRHTLERVSAVSSLDAMKADLLIEAAVEQLNVKQALFAEVEKINDEKVILATNTSSLSVTAIASTLRDPSRCIGLHFFNPADRMKLVEVISGERTSPEVKNSLLAFVHTIQKTAVTAKDSPGFIVNRVARPYYAEALKQLDNGSAKAKAIDRLLRSSGFRMGPFELMDLIGVDTNLSVTTSVYEGMGRPVRFEPSATQRELVKAGRLGRKSGSGFYEYAEKVS